MKILKINPIYKNDPETQKNRYINLTSELIGTFILTIALLILVALSINNSPLIDYITLNTITHSSNKFTGIIVFIYVAILIGLLIIIFDRWSANLNPSISLYLLLKKRCSVKYTLQKILAQFIGAILAGLIAFFIAYGSDYNNIVNNAMGGFNSDTIASFGTKGSAGQIISANFTVLIIEALAAIGICYFLFSSQIKKPFHFIFIAVYFGLAISTALSTGVVGFNPARSFGPALFHDFYLLSIHQLTLGNSELFIYPMFFIAPFIGVVIYYNLEKCTNYYLKMIFHKISFKNKK